MLGVACMQSFVGNHYRRLSNRWPTAGRTETAYRALFGVLTVVLITAVCDLQPLAGRQAQRRNARKAADSAREAMIIAATSLRKPTMQSRYVNLLRAMLTAPLLLMAAAASVAGPLEDALVAQDNGDYATALRLIRPLAETREAPIAQYNLGIMYFTGQGRAKGQRRSCKMVFAAQPIRGRWPQHSTMSGVMYFSGAGPARRKPW